MVAWAEPNLHGFAGGLRTRPSSPADLAPFAVSWRERRCRLHCCAWSEIGPRGTIESALWLRGLVVEGKAPNWVWFCNGLSKMRRVLIENRTTTTHVARGHFLVNQFVFMRTTKCCHSKKAPKTVRIRPGFQDWSRRTKEKEQSSLMVSKSIPSL